MYALPPTYNHKHVETEVEKFWKENKIPERFRQMNPNGPTYAFLEGPPTVNGYMHIGHARGRIYKDLVLRYQTLKGMNVWRRAGWDCQGLPTEIEVEKRLMEQLGTQKLTKRDIEEKIGLEKFVEEANKLVDYYIEKWRKDSERLALWLDYDNAYETRKERYMEHVWHLLKKAYQEGDLTLSYKVVPVCPRCETPLSSHELAQGYEEIEDYSIYVKFKLADRDASLLVWTTTPWTLPANEAVAVHPDEEYLEVLIDGERLIVAAKLLEKVTTITGKNYQIVRRLSGDELVGLRYIHPLAEEVSIHGTHLEPAHTVLPAEFVSMEEGTGLVHIAPGHGPEDFELGRIYGLPVLCPINQSGYFTQEAGNLKDLYHKEASIIILDILRSKGLLFHEDRIIHSYPHCWRCGTPLIYLSSRQWFLKVDRIKKIMIEENSKVKWYPPWAGESRFGEWLQNAEDWCISRTKIWGTPLNVWTCEKCGAIKVVGSKEELLQADVKPPVIRLHRPWIDQFIFRCKECGGEMKREPFVLDTWLDSGVAHFASIDYLSDKKLFERLFPYDFITEAIDQTRGWFYTLLFTSALMFEKAPYKVVLNQGHVLDKEGKKMSKSRGNVIWASEAFERWGVDNLRLYILSKAQPWDSINFDPEEVRQVESTLNILWNVVSFAKTYFDLDRYDPEREGLEAMLPYAEPEDRWLVSRINSLIRYITGAIERFEFHEAARAILKFASEDLSRTYVRAVRRRFWAEERTFQKLASYAALYYVIIRYLIVLSIFAPYISEYLYQLLRSKSLPESVNFNKWPRPDDRLIDQELEDAMQIVEDIITASLNARQRGKRKLRWPVLRVIISPNTYRVKEACEKFKNYLMRQINCFSLEILEPSKIPVETVIKVEPVLSRLGPKAGKRLPLVIEALKNLKPREVSDTFESGKKYELVLPDKSVFELEEGDVVFTESLPEYLVMGEEKFGKVYIDLREDQRLRAVSISNELIRRIQVMRKELKLEITQEAQCMIYLDSPTVSDYIRQMTDYIEEETRTRLTFLREPPSPDMGYIKEWKINDNYAIICLAK
ncbi:MAG: isoleucine--tRNA ligase [Nitrososphaerota archaeon]